MACMCRDVTVLTCPFKNLHKMSYIFRSFTMYSYIIYVGNIVKGQNMHELLPNLNLNINAQVSAQHQFKSKLTDMGQFPASRRKRKKTNVE